MISVYLSDEHIRYDVHALIKAFFPKEDLIFVTENEPFDLGVFLEDKETLISWEENLSIKKRTVSQKDAIKTGLYELLSEVTKKTLPWGILTGIRPIKLFVKELDLGYDEKKVQDNLKDKYLISEKKAKLATQIAQRERNLLRNITEDTYSLYVGIPFCPSICAYCSFSSSPIALFRQETDRYVTALLKELEAVSSMMLNHKLISVYIGGGTPTTLGEIELERIISFIKNKFNISELREFTVEAGRPDSITREKLFVLKALGVDRISVNPQTMQQETLERIGRAHRVEDVLSAVRLVREMGFDVMNMDLILGLPGEGRRQVEDTIKRVLELEPENITVHALALKRASRLRTDEAFFHTTDETESDMETLMDDIYSHLADQSYEPYYLYRQKQMAGNLENVGFSKPNRYGLYNVLIMEEVQSIIACGAGSITKRVYADGRIERADCVKDVKLYMERIDEMIEKKRKLFCDMPSAVLQNET